MSGIDCAFLLLCSSKAWKQSRSVEKVWPLKDAFLLKQATRVPNPVQSRCLRATKANDMQ